MERNLSRKLTASKLLTWNSWTRKIQTVNSSMISYSLFYYIDNCLMLNIKFINLKTNCKGSQNGWRYFKIRIWIIIVAKQYIIPCSPAKKDKLKFNIFQNAWDWMLGGKKFQGLKVLTCFSLPMELLDLASKIGVFEYSLILLEPFQPCSSMDSPVLVHVTKCYNHM